MIAFIKYFNGIQFWDAAQLVRWHLGMKRTINKQHAVESAEAYKYRAHTTSRKGFWLGLRTYNWERDNLKKRLKTQLANYDMNKLQCSKCLRRPPPSKFRVAPVNSSNNTLDNHFYINVAPMCSSKKRIVESISHLLIDIALWLVRLFWDHIKRSKHEWPAVWAL